MILALDLSLTATGWAKSDGSSGVIVPRGEFSRGVDRLRWIRRSVDWLLIESAAVARIKNDLLVGTEPETRVSLVVIEGYAFGVQGQQGHISLGELGGVIRCTLADRDIPFVEIPPKSLKLFATGKGNAKKADVLEAAIHQLDFRGNDHNEADARWLLEMAIEHYCVRTGLSHRHRALEKIEFPVLPQYKHSPITTWTCTSTPTT